MRGGMIVTTADDPCHRGGKEGGEHTFATLRGCAETMSWCKNIDNCTYSK